MRSTRPSIKSCRLSNITPFSELGEDVTEPNPKWIALDDVIFKQGTPT